MRDEIDDCTRGCRMGVTPIPQLVLPPELTLLDSGKRSAGAANLPGGGQGRGKRAQVDRAGDEEADPEWWSTNPHLVPQWGVPSGKQFKDFFDSKDPKTKSNTKGWPEIRHHKSGAQRPICLRYQTVGKCRGQCYLAHMNPTMIPENARSSITDKLELIYK
jgi:hypothetical protein